jgi:hypothetical protein
MPIHSNRGSPSAAFLFALAFFLLPVMTLAQTGQQTSKPPAGAAPPAQGKSAVAMPDTNKMTLLIQNTMAALAQANLTGNYTVLHALGAPGFQQSNTPAKLAEVFAVHCKAGFDVTPVILYRPRLTQQPALDANGMLRLTGVYDTEPKNVRFDLLFQPVGGMWRIFGISVQPAEPTATAQKKENPPAGPSAKAQPAGAKTK